MKEVTRLNHVFECRLFIINSSLRNQSNAAGVAIILSRQYVAWKESMYWELIPGRALLVQIPWRNSRETKRTILAVYAPNPSSENRDFWTELTNIFKRRDIPKPDFMMGDFNIVEDALDRIPAHADDNAAVEELRKLKTNLNLVDGWRNDNPNGKAYSFLQSATGIQSRIDRIYVTRQVYETMRKWEITNHGIISDHKLVSAHYFDPGIPKVGEGRWTILLYAIQDADFMKSMEDLLQETTAEAKRADRTNGNSNPQKVFAKYKFYVTEKAKQWVKEKVPEMKQLIRDREDDLKRIVNSKTLDEPTRKEQAAALEEELRALQLRHHASLREAIHLKYSMENEKVGKTWVRANKEVKTRDYIPALERTGEGSNSGLEYDSKKMADIAREYHEKIQLEGACSETNKEERGRIMTEVLETLERTLTTEQEQELDTPITVEEIREAIFDSASEKAPGLDGVPIEFWKAMTSRPPGPDDFEHDPPPEDAATLLHLVFNDITENGIEEGTHFAKAVLLTPPQLLMESTTAWQTPVDSTTKFPKKEITIVEAY
jgi:exonuclease III